MLRFQLAENKALADLLASILDIFSSSLAPKNDVYHMAPVICLGDGDKLDTPSSNASKQEIRSFKESETTF